MVKSNPQHRNNNGGGFSPSAFVVLYCLTSQSVAADSEPAELACEISIVERNDASLSAFSATITGEPGLPVRYSLTVRKTDDAGTTQSAQSGDVPLSNDGRATAGSIAISMGADADYRVRMTIEASDGRMAECQLGSAPRAI